MRYINPGKETTTEEKYARAIILCRNCITYSAYMAYMPHGRKPVESIGFWTDAYNSFLYLFVIDWYTLFKEGKKNHLYWGNIIPKQKHGLFQAELLKATGLSATQYSSYKSGIISFRNKMVAHMDNKETYIKPPSIYSGQKAVCFLYDYLLTNGVFPEKFSTKGMLKSYDLWHDRAQQADNAMSLKSKS